MTGWSNTDYELALHRAFVDRQADCVVITSRREHFQSEAANYGIGQGWLEGEWDEQDEQSAAFVCRLTPAGRKHFGLDAAKLAGGKEQA